MKLTITEQIEKSIEVTFPCFVKFGEHYYLMVDQYNVINVAVYDFVTSVEHYTNGCCNPFGNAGWEFITEQEFDAALEKALDVLNSLKSVQP